MVQAVVRLHRAESRSSVAGASRGSAFGCHVAGAASVNRRVAAAILEYVVLRWDPAARAPTWGYPSS